MRHTLVTLRPLTVPALLAATLLAACAPSSTSTPATSPPATGAPTPTPTEPSAAPPLDLAALVQADDVVTGPLHLTRRGEAYRSISLQIVRRGGGERDLYVVTRTRTGAEPTYEALRARDAYAAVSPRPKGAPDSGSCTRLVGGVDLCASDRPGVLTWTDDAGASWQRHPSSLDGLLLSPVDALAPGVLAVIGGSDGATLFPFEAFEKSTDAGTTWTSGDFPVFDAARAYSSGGAVLSDGRLLTVLGAFSDDRPRRPAERPHGLYVSDGSDWTRMTPADATFDPPLPDTGDDSALETVSASAAPDPVVWVETLEGLVYVSTDEAATFTLLDLASGTSG